MQIMRLIDSLLAHGIFAILILTTKCFAANQISEDEQLVDLLPIDSTHLIEQNRDALQPGEERQPLVDIPVELSKLKSAFEWDRMWPTKRRALGSVSAVSFDNDGNVIVFHRGDHIWDAYTFSQQNVYMPRNRGPIADKTIVAFNRRTGEIAYEWGDKMFYMPHGLHVDHESNVWVTDVALHQVMKFTANSRVANMTLGERFQPGTSLKRFCKPTAVAVLLNGDFFVADGYCNTRIIKYSRDGTVLLSWGKNSFQGVSFTHAPPNFFAVPHALALATDLGLLCVADRENGRVQCFNTSDGTYHSQYHSGIIGDRLFSVAYAPINGGQLIIVNGQQIYPQQTQHKVLGFIIDMQTRSVISKFGPDDQQFDNPHDVIVSPDGSEIYVAQLSPNIAFKFTTKNKVPTNITNNVVSLSNVTNAAEDQIVSITTKSNPSSRTNPKLMMIGGLFVMFICITLLALWVVARRRKLDLRNRRHAWDFPTVKSDGFKLGNLLDRDRKRGFEKLNQEGSDEESNSSTNALLSNAQFTKTVDSI